MYKYTPTVSSVLDLTTCIRLPFAPGEDAPTGDNRTGDQIVSIDVVGSATGAAATIELVLIDPNETTDKKVRVESATVTPTAYRSASAGASGGYVCTVAFASTGTNKVDLNGQGRKPRTITGTSSPTVASQVSDACYWVLGQSAAGGAGTLTVRITPTRTI